MAQDEDRSSCTTTRRRHGLTARQKLIAFLPRYAPWASRLAPLLNLRDRDPGPGGADARSWLGTLGQAIAAAMAARYFLELLRAVAAFRAATPATRESRSEVVLLADTFNNYFEPENLRARMRSAGSGGLSRAHRRPRVTAAGRCAAAGPSLGRAGRRGAREARRLIEALEALRRARRADRRPRALVPVHAARRIAGRCFRAHEVETISRQALLFEEFLARETRRGSLKLPLETPRASARCCTAIAIRRHSAPCRRWSRRCADSRARGRDRRLELLRHGRRFGYEAEHFDVSMRMAEASLLPERARGAARYADRRGRHQLPASDPRRRRARGVACGAGARAALQLSRPDDVDEAGSQDASSVSCCQLVQRRPGRLAGLAPLIGPGVWAAA